MSYGLNTLDMRQCIDTMTKKAKKTPTPAEQEPGKAEDLPAAEDGTEPEVLEETADQEGEEAPDYRALYEEAREKALRRHAEFENYRKRTQREYGVVRAQTKASTIEEFLTVYDHFGMALSHSGEDPSVLREGMEMIFAEFRRTFETLGVEELDTLGQPFDPAVHEALAQEASADVPEGHVLRQWKAGFRMGDKLLRPATVVVSAGPEAAGETDGEQRENQ